MAVRMQVRTTFIHFVEPHATSEKRASSMPPLGFVDQGAEEHSADVSAPRDAAGAAPASSSEFARNCSTSRGADERSASIGAPVATSGAAPASSMSAESPENSSTAGSGGAPAETTVRDGGCQLPMSPHAHNRLVRELKHFNENFLGPPARGYQANAAGTEVKTASGMLPVAPASLRAWWRAYFRGGASDAGAAAPKPAPKTPKPSIRSAKSRRQVSTARDCSAPGLRDIKEFNEILADFAVPRTTLSPVAPVTRQRRWRRAERRGRGASVDRGAPNEGMADSARGDAPPGGVDATLVQPPALSVAAKPDGGEVAASTRWGASTGGRGAAPDLDLPEFVDPNQSLAEFVEEEPNQSLAAFVEGANQGLATSVLGRTSAGGAGESSRRRSAAEIIDELNATMAEPALEGMSAGGREETEPDRFLAEFVEKPSQGLAASVPGSTSAGGEMESSPPRSTAAIIDELRRRAVESPLEGISAGGCEGGEPDQFMAKFVEDPPAAFLLLHFLPASAPFLSFPLPRGTG